MREIGGGGRRRREPEAKRRRRKEGGRRRKRAVRRLSGRDRESQSASEQITHREREKCAHFIVNMVLISMRKKRKRGKEEEARSAFQMTSRVWRAFLPPSLFSLSSEKRPQSDLFF